MLTGGWKERRRSSGHRGSRGRRMRCRVNYYDAWEESYRWGLCGRWRKEHTRDRCNDHRTGIRRDDDKIGFKESGSCWGFGGSEVQFVRDDIAYDLAHGGN